jgi:hypothetical protein
VSVQCRKTELESELQNPENESERSDNILVVPDLPERSVTSKSPRNRTHGKKGKLKKGPKFKKKTCDNCHQVLKTNIFTNLQKRSIGNIIIEWAFTKKN